MRKDTIGESRSNLVDSRVNQRELSKIWRRIGISFRFICKTFAIMSLSGASQHRSSGFTENYFSVDDILATQERVPSKFEVSLQNLGELTMTACSVSVTI